LDIDVMKSNQNYEFKLRPEFLNNQSLQLNSDVLKDFNFYFSTEQLAIQHHQEACRLLKDETIIQFVQSLENLDSIPIDS